MATDSVVQTAPDKSKTVSQPAIDGLQENQRTSPEKFFGDTITTPENFFGDGDVTIYKPQEETEKLGFLDRVKQDLEKRNKMGMEIADAVTTGEQTYAEGMLQIAGKVGAGAVLDVIGEGLVSGVRVIGAITPDIILTPMKDAVTWAGHEFLNTDVGKAGLQAAQNGIEAYQDWSIDNPRATRNLESVINIAFLVAPTKAKPSVAAPPTIIGRAGEKVAQAAEKQVLKNKESFVDDLVRPKQTATVKEAQVPRTIEVGKGPLKKSVIEPSPKEANAAKEVLKIDGVGADKTIQGNYNLISKEISTEAESLLANLKSKDVVFPRKEFSAQLNKAVVELGENPLIVGDAQKTAQKIVDKMIQITKEKPSTVSNLLQSRKELDTWMKSQKGPNIFDPQQEGAISIALRSIRQTTNDFIDSKATTAGVKDSLKKQSNLYRALDNIAPKAADEADTAILRAWKNLLHVMPLRGEFNQTMAALFGIGGLGASALFAPFFTAIAGLTIGTYMGGKFVIGPSAKKGVATLLNKTDEAIRIAKDKNLISALRADRAALIELSEYSKESIQKDKIDESSNQPETDQ